MGYKVGELLVAKVDGINKIAMVVNKVIHNKKTKYDLLFENMSVILAVPIGDVSNNVYIDSTITKLLNNSDSLKSTLPDYKELVESGQIPSVREAAIGPRSF